MNKKRTLVIKSNFYIMLFSIVITLMMVSFIGIFFFLRYDLSKYVELSLGGLFLISMISMMVLISFLREHHRLKLKLKDEKLIIGIGRRPYHLPIEFIDTIKKVDLHEYTGKRGTFLGSGMLTCIIGKKAKTGLLLSLNTPQLIEGHVVLELFFAGEQDERITQFFSYLEIAIPEDTVDIKETTIFEYKHESLDHINIYIIYFIALLLTFFLSLWLLLKDGIEHFLDKSFTMIVFALAVFIFFTIYFYISRWMFSIKLFNDRVVFRNGIRAETICYFEDIEEMFVANRSQITMVLNDKKVGNHKNAEALVIKMRLVEESEYADETYSEDDIEAYFKQKIVVFSKQAPKIKELILTMTEETSFDTKSQQLSAIFSTMNVNKFTPKRFAMAKKIATTLIVLTTIACLGYSIVSDTEILNRINWSKKARIEKEFDVFDYAHVTFGGVEGDASIYLSRHRADGAPDATSEMMEYINEGKFYYGETEVPQYFGEGEHFAINNGDVVVIRFEANPEMQKKSKLKPKHFEIEATAEFLGEMITEENIGNYFSAIKNFEVTSLEYSNYLMPVKYRAIEEKINNSELIPKGLYYKVEDTYAGYSSKELTETSGLTILFAYEYQGDIYLRGSTNIYGWFDNTLSSTNMFDYAFLKLTSSEAKVENIQEAMHLRGYQYISESEVVI